MAEQLFNTPANTANQLRGMYGEDMFQQASQLAGLIKSYRAEAQAQRKTETMSPYVSALQNAANQYNTATDDTGRQNASALANLTRENMIRGGISPADIDQRYWGSDPTRGFQTTSGFEAPVTGYEGLKRTQAIDALRNSLADLMERQKWEKSPESQDWYLPLAKQDMEAGIAVKQRSANAPYGGGGSSGGGSGGSSSSSSSSSLNSRATQAAVAQVWQYNTPEEAVTAYGYYGPDMASQGVDLSKVWTELKKRWPDYKAFTGEDE